MKRLVLAGLIAAAFAFGQEGGHAQSASQGEAAGGHEQPTDYTNWKWANFVILVGGLGYLASKGLPAFFASRTAEIRKGLDEARKLRAASEARSKEIEARLAGLGAEVEFLRTGARAEASAEGERIRRETALEMEKIQAQADHEIASAAKAAQAELQAHAAGLALELARQKLAARMTGGDQDALIRAFVHDMKVAK